MKTPNERNNEVTTIRPCEQNCGDNADVYAIDPIAGGWGGYYCHSCSSQLKGWQVTEKLNKGDNK